MKTNQLIKRDDLLRVYEQNLSRDEKSSLSQLLGYAQASGLKTYLRRKPDAYLSNVKTDKVIDFFSTRRGFSDQLSIANRKLATLDFAARETEDLLAQIKSMIARLQGISDIEYLEKVKQGLTVLTATIDTQIQINNL